MNTNGLLMVVITCAGVVSACAATVPKELVNAREAYRRSSHGSTARIAPAELHVAYEALTAAEKSFEDDPDSYQTRDLAYVAQRKAQMADAKASIVTEQKSQAQAEAAFESTQGKIVDKTKTALAASQRSGAQTAQQLAAEQAARADADKRAADAQAALAKLAAVKEEPRGLVITLSGSVLFASNQATLLSEARTKIDQVAAVLLTTRERNITVEGHTDSQGSDSHNQDLSQRRADSVRNELVQRGYEGDLIQARGMGEGTPIADNASPEGRANNRRVEIIIQQPDLRTSSN